MKEELQNASEFSQRRLGFEFRGEGGEYFKIWIVNVLLTILTLGVYSAWAKVRTNRYFYSNLYLDDNNFRYLADPITILKGRIIAVVSLVLFTLVSSQNDIAALVLSVIFLFAIPFFVNQGLIFSNRMSAYNNIQFRFKGTYREAFLAIYVWPIIGMITLGILYPLALLRVNQYVVRNSAYGTSDFEFSATYRDYGIIFLIAFGLILVFAIPVGILGAMMPSWEQYLTLPMTLGYLGVYIYFSVDITNLYFSCTKLLEHEFESKLEIRGFSKVFLSNLFFIVITLGLFLPVAKVRMTKYLASCIALNTAGSLDNFAAAEKENISALGEEFGQVFDFGI